MTKAFFLSHRLKIAFVLSTIVALVVLLYPTVIVTISSWGKLHDSAENVPAKDVALVFGCSVRVGGQENPYFNYRMDAAAQLFIENKVKCIIVSGDNRTVYYNEPLEMTKALVKRGVPFEKIVLDYAGLRTLDSVVRAKKVFGVEDVIFVSQKFHNQRALYLAKANGIKAVGYNAKDVSLQYGARTQAREVLARVKMWLDVNILDTQPHHLGKKEALPL